MEDLVVLPIILDFVTNETQTSTSHLQRTLAFVAAGLILLSLAAIVAAIVAAPLGAGADNGFSKGAWPLVLDTPVIALPLGFALIIALLVISAVHRSRAR